MFGPSRSAEVPEEVLAPEPANPSQELGLSGFEALGGRGAKWSPSRSSTVSSL